jgi:hypothetical protein
MEEIRQPSMRHNRDYGSSVCSNETPVKFRKVDGNWLPFSWTPDYWEHVPTWKNSTMTCLICGADVTPL